MPISLLEAMSYGRNVLVSDIDENTQVIGKYGTSFKKGNIDDLAQKIQESLNEKNRKNSEDIENYILKKYNWNVIINKTIDIYKNLGGTNE